MRFRFLMLAAAFLAAACGKTGEEPSREVKAPAVPADVRLHAATETTLTFQWANVEGAVSYDWKLSRDGNAEKSGTSAKRNVTVEGLTPGTAYAFAVCAANEAGKSGWSTAVEAVTEGTAPGPVDPSVQAVCVDAPLVLTLDSSPVLGTAGLIRVFTEAGKEVDRIDLADLSRMTALADGTLVPAGADADKGQIAIGNDYPFHTFLDALHSNQYRVVHYTPVRVKGKQLEIKLHNEALDFGRQYYLTVDESVAGKAVAEGE